MARPVFSLLLLVVMIQIIGGAASEEARTFVVLGSALWAMLVAGIAGPAWSVLEDRERYRMLKYLYVSPATFLVLLVGRGGARLATGAMGTVVALVFAVIVLGLRVDLAAVDWPLLVAALVMGLVPIIALGVLLAAVCLQTRQESWSYPDAFAGALFLISGVVFPLAVLPYPVQAIGLVNPITWWLAAVRLAVVPDGPSSIGGTGSLWTAVTGTAAPDATTVLCALFVTGCAGYTRGDRDLPIERTTCPRTGPARPDHRLVAIRSGAAPRGAWDAAAREQTCGSTREVPARTSKRSSARSVPSWTAMACGTSCCSRCRTGSSSRAWRPPGPRRSAWSESVGIISKETLSFLDEDIAKFMEEAAQRRGTAEAAGAAEPVAGLHEQALRVIGHWIDQQKPKDVFLFEQEGAYVVRLNMGGQAGVHHELAEFTRDDVEGLVAQAPALRNKPSDPAG